LHQYKNVKAPVGEQGITYEFVNEQLVYQEPECIYLEGA
jgi:hypothetical protein